VFATMGVVVAAAYLLAFVGRVFHGPLRDELRALPDLRIGEYAVLVPFILAIFWVGFYPQPLLSRSEATVAAILGRVAAAQSRPVSLHVQSVGAPSRAPEPDRDRCSPWQVLKACAGIPDTVLVRPEFRRPRTGASTGHSTDLMTTAHLLGARRR